MAVAGRTHRPVIDHGRCTPCSICVGTCPVEMTPEMTREENSLRAGIARKRGEKRVLIPPLNPQSPPCQAACPLHQDVRAYIGHIAAGRYREALEVIRATNPLPSVCGYVCPRPCEASCMRGFFDEAVAIRRLKRFVTSKVSVDLPQRVLPGGVKVGVVGAGPAGLTAAHDLALQGFSVEVIESFDEPGGMPAWAIPEFRLPREVLRRDIAYLRHKGVHIRTGLAFGRDITLSDLKKEGISALIVATGTQRGLALPGEETGKYEGYLDCLDFLRSCGRSLSLDKGVRVLVLGGGNAAFDSARSAVRLGAGEVKVLYRRGPEQMPAHPHEIEAALGEGVNLAYFTAPKRILSSGGKVKGLECIRTELREETGSGGGRPVPIPGSAFELEADMVICAMGQAPDPGPVARGLWGERAGSLEGDQETGCTNMPGVFMAGDFLNGPTTVVEAMASGRRAARAVERYLSEEGLLFDG